MTIYVRFHRDNQNKSTSAAIVLRQKRLNDESLKYELLWLTWNYGGCTLHGKTCQIHSSVWGTYILCYF